MRFLARLALGILTWIAERFAWFRIGQRSAERKGLERDAKNTSESNKRREEIGRLDDVALDDRVRRSQE